MNVRVTEEAKADPSSAIRYYNRQRAGLGREFRTEVAATIDRIVSLPDSSRPLEDDVRRRRTERFPYGIFYRLLDDGIVILAIVHLSRDSGSWRSRL
jgi:plasmid stabilization system protein ParE